MNTRQTRGVENRKPTQKYALFQNRPQKEVEEESIRSLQSVEDIIETNQNDKYILKLCKQQSKNKKQDDNAQQLQPKPTKKLVQKGEDKTCNSTPMKPETPEEQLEIEDLENILDETGKRYMKNKQLVLEMQKSSVSRATSNIFMQNSLMPRRIMSSKKSNSKMSISQKAISEHFKRVEEEEMKAQKKEPKDRSALVGLKRTRKSRDQIYKLQKCYTDSKGKPTKAQLKQLSKDTGLKLQQVYKWYWDTEKKNDKLQKELKQNNPTMRSPLRLSRKILKTQYTDEFGGYSKTWFSDGIKDVQDKQNEGGVVNLLEQKSDMSDIDQADFGMDGLARMVGLDIEEIAVNLALYGDKSIPPTQCHVIQEDDNCEIYRRYKLTKSMRSCSNYSRSSTPQITKKQIKPECSQQKKTKSSPIINPIVLRPCADKTMQQNGSKTNSIVVNKPVYGGIQKKPEQGKQMFSPDKINNAFQNLFGGSNQNNQGSVMQMQTPSFFDTKHQIKAKPLMNAQRSMFDNQNQERKISSVFSPIPCKPQSQCSIFGVRGDNNTPYTPFNKTDVFTPKVQPSPVNTGRIFKAPAMHNSLNLMGQHSRKSGNPKEYQAPLKEKVTPSMFLQNATPIDQKSSPSLSKNVFNLFGGHDQNSGLLKQTPQTIIKPAQQYTASPPRQTTVINLFTQPVSCSNFYNTCGDSKCGANNCRGESNSSFSRNSPNV